MPSYQGGAYRNEVVVLMYHAFRSDPAAGDVISPTDFAHQLALFHQEGFHPITLQRFEAFISGTSTVPPNALLLTFDNGYQSFYHQVFPMLKRYHYPAVLFVIVRWLYPGGAPSGIDPLTWAEVRAMANSGLVSVQSQSWNLHAGVATGPDTSEAADIGRAWLPGRGRESLAEYERRVEGDLVRARKVLQTELGTPVNAYAYPFGDYTPLLIHLLHKAGYRYLFTAKLGWANISGQNPAILYRINTGAYTTHAATALEAIRLVARDTARNPRWRPPAQYVEVWHP